MHVSTQRSSRALLALLITLTMAAPAAYADIAPPKGLKRIDGEVVFSGLAAHKGHTFVLVERSGPQPGQCHIAVDGKPYTKLSYRWWSPALYAVKGAGVKADAALCKKLMADKKAPKLDNISPTPVTVSDTHKASTVRVTYTVSAVSATAVTGALSKREFFDSAGQPVADPATQKNSSSCAVGGDAAPGAGSALALLLLAVALLARRRGRAGACARAADVAR